MCRIFFLFLNSWKLFSRNESHQILNGIFICASLKFIFVQVIKVVCVKKTCYFESHQNIHLGLVIGDDDDGIRIWLFRILANKTKKHKISFSFRQFLANSLKVKWNGSHHKQIKTQCSGFGYDKFMRCQQPSATDTTIVRTSKWKVSLFA